MAFIVGWILVAVGLLFGIGAFANAVGIHLLSSGPNAKTGNGLLGIVLAALPLVVGLVILSKLQKSKESGEPESSDVA